MSHVAAIECKIKDLNALERAAKSLGLLLNRGQKTFKWFGQWVNDYNATDAAYRQGYGPEDYGKCEHAISIPGNPSAYEVGVVPAKDGNGFTLLYDFYSGGHGMTNMIGGKHAEKLIQAYKKEVVLAEPTIQSLMLEGAQSQLIEQENGDQTLIIEY
jgi:hypothetical protein